MDGLSARQMTASAIPAESATLLDLHADMSLSARQGLALADVALGSRLWRLAWTLGWLDIKLRYRGSLLGPFWLTMSTGVMVGALGLLYAGLFHTNLHDYLPYLSLSLVLWAFLGAVVSESCATFTEAEAIIRSVRMPFFLFSLRIVIRNVLVLAHNILVIIVVFALLSTWPGWHMVLALPGILLWLLDALALSLLLGSFCARFRDIQPIVNSVMQIAFFMTPVIWKPEQAGGHFVLLQPNPFFDLLQVVRAPLLGQSPGTVTWLAAALYSVGLCAIAWLFFARARGRVAFWL